jgi:hypothetical protein
VLVAKKDFNAPKHDDLEVPNLEVIKAMQSLNSKGYVKTQFSWQYYYYTLTNEGLDYLRELYVCSIKACLYGHEADVDFLKSSPTPRDRPNNP